MRRENRQVAELKGERVPSRRTQLGLKLGVLTVVLSVFVIAWLELRCVSSLPEGVDLNRTAWEASYRERGETPPGSGPREGYWGARLGSKAFDTHTGWRERAIEAAGLVSIDERGLQHWQPAEEASHRVLFVGGSVAFGAYASSIESSYFADVGRQLEAAGESTRVSVLASGGWWSANELSALRRYGLDPVPDVVVFLDGLNDLSERRDIDARRRVAAYLRNLEEARSLARAVGADVIFAMQPFSLDKRRPTDLERRILCISCDESLPRSTLSRRYREMRLGLEALSADAEGTHFFDVSGIFSAMPETTFTDLWHFSDAGHAALADALAPHLLEVLRARQSG